MSAVAETMNVTDERLAGLTLPAGGWSDTARKNALSRVQMMGLPSRRDEYWKYTRPDTLTQAVAVPAALFHNDEAALFDDVERLKIVFVDGAFDSDASDDLSLEGVSIERLATADADIHWARDVYGVLESNGQKPVERP